MDLIGRVVLDVTVIVGLLCLIAIMIAATAAVIRVLWE